MDQIKVAIIDCDFNWIKLIINHIHKEEDMVVLWSAPNKETAIIHASCHDIDIILMNNKLNQDGKDVDNIAATKEIAAISQAKVIMMASSCDETLIKNSVFDGVTNYILKKEYANIPVIIRLTYNQIFSPVTTIFNDYFKVKSELTLSQLTAVEREIYLLKQKGYTASQIAAKTNKSEGTIRNQLSKAYKKLKPRKD
jgi:DNA-binding NarL/FixJ family response regulator